jgi:hypothetical protein
VTPGDEPGTPRREDPERAVESAAESGAESAAQAAAQAAGQAARRREEQRRRRGRVFGDVLPETTRDDRDTGEGQDEEWLRANVPPHHG